MTANKPKKAFSRIGLALAAGIAVSTVIALLACVPLKDPAVLESIVRTIGPSLTLLLTYVPNFIILLVFWLTVRRMPKAEWQKEEMNFKSLTQVFVMMYAVSTVLNLVGTGLTAAAPAGATRALEMISSLVSTGLPAGFLMVALIAPVVEALIFRKLMLGRIRNYGEKTAIFFSALCFGLFHGNLTQFLYAFSVCLFLGYVYCKTGKVIYTMVMHALLNTISSSVMLLAPMMSDGGRFAALAVILCLLVITALFLTGFAQVIRHLKRKDLRLDNTAPACIPGNEVVSTVYLNPGVSLFVLFSIFTIAMQLLNIQLFG